MRSFSDFLLRYLLPLAASFTVCALTVDVLWTSAVLRTTKNSDVSRVRRMIEGDDNRIAIIGSSKAWCSYIPSSLGIPAYNYGLMDTSLFVSNLLIELELSKKDSTTPILLDFPMFWYKSIGDETNFVPFASIPLIQELLKMTGEWKTRYLVPGLRFFGLYDLYLQKLITEKFGQTYRVVDGFTHRITPIPWSREAFNSAVQKRLKASVVYNEIKEQRLQLEKLIADHSNRHFFIVISPVHSFWYHNYEGMGRAQDFLSDMDKKPNVTVLDYSRVDYPDELFMDTSHLNEEGAKRFSSELGETLRAHPALATHRD